MSSMETWSWHHRSGSGVGKYADPITLVDSPGSKSPRSVSPERYSWLSNMPPVPRQRLLMTTLEPIPIISVTPTIASAVSD